MPDRSADRPGQISRDRAECPAQRRKEDRARRCRSRSTRIFARPVRCPRAGHDGLREPGRAARRFRVPAGAVDAADRPRLRRGVLGDVDREGFGLGRRQDRLRQQPQPARRHGTAIRARSTRRRRSPPRTTDLAFCRACVIVRRFEELQREGELAHPRVLVDVPHELVLQPVRAGLKRTRRIVLPGSPST